MERKILLVFINARSNTIWKQLAGIFQFLGEHPGWIPKLVSLPEEFTPELISSAERDGYDAIVINHAGSDATAKALCASRIPLAVLGIRDARLLRRRHKIVFTRHDNRLSGKLAAHKFLSLGQFAAYCYIHPRGTPPWSQDRAHGFIQEIKRHEKSPNIIVSALTDLCRDLIDTLNALPRPVAILTANDFCALEVLQVCNANGIKVPTEVSVMGVGDDEAICEHTSPPLSSIRFNFAEDSYQAALELERMQTAPARNRAPKTFVCGPDRVVDRESVAAMAPSVTLYRRAVEFIQKNAKNGISAKDVARAMGVSESLLSLRFRELAKKSVWETITDIRLKSVKRLLASTNRSIGEITRQTGFNDANNLKRLFKAKVGMTMRDWRTQSRKNDP